MALDPAWTIDMSSPTVSAVTRAGLAITLEAHLHPSDADSAHLAGHLVTVPSIFWIQATMSMKNISPIVKCMKSTPHSIITWRSYIEHINFMLYVVQVELTWRIPPTDTKGFTALNI